MDDPIDPPRYERVTNPERYAVLHDAARDVLAELEAEYDVDRRAGTLEQDFPRERYVDGDVIRLTPLGRDIGDSLAFIFTTFPGLHIRFGRFVDSFPRCGCDACDEPPDDLVADVRNQVASFTGGGYTEALTRTRFGHCFVYPGGTQSGREFLERGERRLLKPRGEYRVEPWPRRLLD